MLLTVAARAEHAAVALRRATTTGQDHHAAAAELLAAAAELATLHDTTTTGTPPSAEQTSTPQHDPLPDSVTTTAPPSRSPAPKSHRPPAGPAQRSSGRVTKPVTNQATRQHTTHDQRPQPIDPDTVRLQRSADLDLTGTWRVVAGPADDPMLVGYVRRNSPGKTWEARTPALITISGGPWRTRQDALVQLVLNHQQATTRRSSKHRPR